MDRIHRLGQHRPVVVTKLVVEDSIESKIVQLQEKKLAMTTAALSRDPEESLGKLTPEDVLIDRPTKCRLSLMPSAHSHSFPSCSNSKGFPSSVLPATAGPPDGTRDVNFLRCLFSLSTLFTNLSTCPYVTP